MTIRIKMHGSNYADCTRQLMIDEALDNQGILDDLVDTGHLTRDE